MSQTDMIYIDESGVAGLQRYTYKSKDLSITYQYVLGPAWDQMIHFVPLWLAPNVITLIGLCLTIISFFLVSYYNPYLNAPCPPWLYLLTGVFLLIYQTLDNLDGRQARRTGTSSPLGELFDHGCDVITVTLSGVAVASTLQLGPTWQTFLLIWGGGMLPFFLGTLEEYHTGALILRQINGPIEGLLLMASIHIFTFYTGPEVWTANFWDVFGFLKMGYSVSPLPINKLLVCLLPLAIVPTIFYNLMYIKKRLDEQNKSFSEVIRNLVPFISLSVLGSAWLYLSPKLVEDHPILFFSLIGSLFSIICTRLILAYLCQYEYTWATEYLVPLVMCIGNSLMASTSGQPLIDENYILPSYFLVASAAYLHYALSIISEIRTALDLSFFTIPNRSLPRA